MQTNKRTTKRGNSMKAMKATLGLLTMLALGVSVRAQTINDALIVDPGTGTVRTDTATIGYEFLLSSPATVYAIGVWDGSNGAGIGDGLGNSHDVGLWSYPQNTQIATVSIPSGNNTTLIGEFRYVALSTPVTLQANQDYLIGDFHGSDPWLSPSATMSLGSSVSQVVDGQYASSAFLAEPLSAGGGVAFVGPNLLFTPIIPEPGIASLFLCGLNVLWWRRKR